MDARQQVLFFLKFLRTALNYRYPLSGVARALFTDEQPDDTGGVGFTGMPNAQKLFSRIIPQSSWTYSLYRTGEHRFECLQTPGFSFLHAPVSINEENFTFNSRDGIKISALKDSNDTGILYLFYRNDPPRVEQLPALLEEERAAHPLNAIRTHDRAWIERLEKSWWLYRQIPIAGFSATGKKLHDRVLAFFSGNQHTDNDDIWPAETLQAFWDEYALPVYEYLWRRWWREGHGVVYPFVLSVIHHNPWWLPRAFALLEKACDPADQSVLTILRIIREKFHVAYQGDRLLFGMSGRETPFVSTVESARFKLSGWNSARKAFTALEIKDALNVKTDKAVQFEYHPGRKELTILPGLPYLSRIRYHAVSLNIAGLAVTVPMVWRQFTLHAGGLRLKFLLKARRWQVSIRWPREMEKIVLDNRTIKRETLNNRQKVYVDWVVAAEPHHSLLFFDAHGRQFNVLPEKNGRLQAAVLDKRGLLVPRGRLISEGGKKSHGVNLINPGELPGQLGRNPRLVIPKSGSITLPVEPAAQDAIGGLKSTPASILETSLVLSAPGSFEDTLFSHTAIRPLLLSLGDAAALYDTIRWHVVVTDDLPVKKCREESLYYVEEQGNCTIIRIKCGEVKKFIKKYFSISPAGSNA